MSESPVVGIILGSKSDIKIAIAAIETLEEFSISYELIVSSAHRCLERTINWVKEAEEKGIKVIIAIAGASAHLAGVAAATTILPVVAVPVASTKFNGVDALLSNVSMPTGVPIATMPLDETGAKNAAIFACQILSINNEQLKTALKKYKKFLVSKVEKDHNEALLLIKKRE